MPPTECAKRGRFYAITHLIAYRSAQEYVEALQTDHDGKAGMGAARGLAREVPRRAVIGWRKFRWLRTAVMALGIECMLFTLVTLIRLVG